MQNEQKNKISWTQSQQQAISTDDKNIIVSAAAGSGKTAVLTQRIVKLVAKDKKNITDMLILTFTNAAANEMKSRIQKKLSEALHQNPDNTHLKNQIAKVSFADISTMHAFCMRLLRENFEIPNIDPSFSIDSGASVSMIKSDCIDAIFTEKYEKEDRDFLNLVNIFSAKGDDKALKQTVFDIHSFIQSKKEPATWLKEQCEKYNGSCSRYLELLKEILLKKINYAHKTASQLVEDANTYWQPYADALNADKTELEILSAKLKANFDDFADEISSCKIPALGRAKAKDGDSEEKEKIKYKRDNIVKQTFKMLSNYAGKSDEYEEYMHKTYNIVKPLTDIVLEFDERFSALKSEKNIMDFNDLEHYTLKLLSDENARQRIKSNYEHIFYDEYQDSNEVQDSIIEALKSENNLFFVGDVKQSIYSFRLARPQIFSQRYKDYSSQRESMKIDLSENFRSSRQVIDFCNRIFEKIMTGETSLVEYDESQRLAFPKSKEAANEQYDPKNISINLIQPQNKKAGSQNDDIEDLQNDELMAVFTAKKILQMTREDENLKFKDIVILKRSLTGVSQIYENVFKQYNIPLFIDFSEGIFSVTEVSIFIDLLKIIDNIKQDIPLLSVMMSGIYDFSADEITSIKACSKGEKFFYKSVLSYANTQSDTLSDKIKGFLSSIEKYSELQKYMPLDEFVNRLLSETHYEDYVRAMPQGKLRIANLNTVKTAVKDFMQSENKTLFYFIMYIDSILKNKSDKTSVKSICEDRNIVRMMSIHKSKGLEFDTVFLNDIQKKFNQADTLSPVLCHADYGIGADYSDAYNRYRVATLPKMIISEDSKKQQICEEIRVLYVALTRAENRLIINALLNPSANKTYTDIAEKSVNRTFDDMKSHADFILYAISDDIQSDFESSKSLYTFKITDYEQIAQIKEQETSKSKNFEQYLPELSDNQLQKIKESYEFEYKNRTDLNKLAKISVTSLSKTPFDYLIEPTKPYAPHDSMQIDTARIGTLNHLFLMTLDFTKKYNLQTLKSHLDNLVKKHYIRPEEKKYIKSDNIMKFVNSDLYARIQNADKIFKEESFITKHDGSLLSGIIDLFFVEKDHIVLIDYKTDNISKKNAEKHAQIYKNQLSLYKDSLENAFELKVSETYVYFLEINTEVRILNS